MGLFDFLKKSDEFISRGRFKSDFFSVEFPGKWKWKKYWDSSYVKKDAPLDEVSSGLRATRLSGRNIDEKRQADIEVLPITMDPLVGGLDNPGKQDFLLSKVNACISMLPVTVHSRQTSFKEHPLWAEAIFTSETGCWHFYRAIISSKAIICLRYDAFQVIRDEFEKEKNLILDSLELR